MAAVLSEKAQAVLSFLQANAGANLTAYDIASALGLTASGVNGVVTGLAKKGLVTRIEVEGFEKKVIQVTPEGAAFDPATVKPDSE